MLGPLEWAGFLSRPKERAARTRAGDYDVRYRTISVAHLRQLKEWFSRLDDEGKLSRHPAFRSAVEAFSFEAPQAMPRARSIIIMATPQRIASVAFALDGRRHLLLIPPSYVDDGLSLRDIQYRISDEVVGFPGTRIVPANLPLKSLAVWSGLAVYGRNNLVFIEEWGSLFRLRAFYIDRVLEDDWDRLRLMRLCKECSTCIRDCPTGALRNDPFVLEVEKCLTLYNERPDPLPDWLAPGIHHALVGCLKCQWGCPANEKAVRRVTHLADLSEEETRMLISGKKDQRLHESVIGKLKLFPAAGDFDWLSRNARSALANSVPR